MGSKPRAEAHRNEKNHQRNIQRETRANLKRSEQLSTFAETKLGASKPGRLPRIESDTQKVLGARSKGAKSIGGGAAKAGAFAEVLADASRALTVSDRFGPSARLKAEIRLRLQPGETVLVDTSELNADGTFDWISIGSPNRDRLRAGSQSAPVDVLKEAMDNAAGSRQHLGNAPTTFIVERTALPVDRCTGENLHGDSSSRRSEAKYRDMEKAMIGQFGRRITDFDSMCEIQLVNP